jgi:hypothetical protein
MTGIIAVGIFLLILFLSRKKKPATGTNSMHRRNGIPNRAATNTTIRLQTAVKMPTDPIPSNIPGSNTNDVIDITGPAERIIRQSYKAAAGKKEVVPWPHRYIYSFNEFSNATREQRAFYYYFKDCFLKAIPVDLKNNTNYTFILLFDLLQEYDSHKDLVRLQSMLVLLGTRYPVTEKYARIELVRRQQERNQFDPSGKGQKIPTQPSPREPDYGIIYPPPIGTRLKKDLSLSATEESLLNNLYYSGNSFFSNVFCQRSVIDLFVRLHRSLDSHFNGEGSSLEEKMTIIADTIARKHFRYRNGTENYKYSILNSKRELRVLLMKLSENTLREQYGFKRKLTVQLPYANEEIVSKLETELLVPSNGLLTELSKNCLPPDENTEIYLNAQNTTRWKTRFEALKTSYHEKKDYGSFFREIQQLADRNKDNPSIESIFFEASRFIGTDDKKTCLILYVYYVYYDQQSEKIDNKALTRTLMKQLFTDEVQEKAFEEILYQLKNDKDLQKALAATAGLFEIKRKKIRLNDTRIREAESAFTETVELLKDYLDEETETTPPPPEELAAASVSAESMPMPPPINDRYLLSLQLNPVQTTLLDIFKKNNFLLGASDLEAYAKDNGAFRNQLIDSINEACYETLDDVLIEEEEENYVIQEHYFQRVQQ